VAAQAHRRDGDVRLGADAGDLNDPIAKRSVAIFSHHVLYADLTHMGT
jgi:hypothetical protein